MDIAVGGRPKSLARLTRVGALRLTRRCGGSGGQLLFHLVSRLYERTSIIVTPT